MNSIDLTNSRKKLSSYVNIEERSNFFINGFVKIDLEETIKKKLFFQKCNDINNNNETKESFLTLVYEEMDDALNAKRDIEKSDTVKNINLTNA